MQFHAENAGNAGKYNDWRLQMNDPNIPAEYLASRTLRRATSIVFLLLILVRETLRVKKRYL
jgi:hypothetical protein